MNLQSDAFSLFSAPERRVSLSSYKLCIPKFSFTFLNKSDFAFRLLTEEVTDKRLIGGLMEFSW